MIKFEDSVQPSDLKSEFRSDLTLKKKVYLPINDQELQFFNLCSSLILMTEKEKFPNENHVSLYVWVCSSRIRGRN